MIHNAFKAMSSLKILSSDNDKTIATAQGNAEWFHMPTTNLLNHSYAVLYTDDTTNKLFIENVFFKDEVLPIKDRKVISSTASATTEIVRHFYLGNDVTDQTGRVYDYSKYMHLTGKQFTFKFRKQVPANTKICSYYSVDTDGVITIRVESDDADTQFFTLISGIQ